MTAPLSTISRITPTDSTREGWRRWSESLAAVYRERWSPFASDELRAAIPDPGAGRRRGLVLTSDLHWLDKVANIRWAFDVIWTWHLESYLERGPYSARDEHFAWLFRPEWSDQEYDGSPDRATWQAWEGFAIRPTSFGPARNGSRSFWYTSGSDWLVGDEQLPHLHEEGLIIEVHWNHELGRYRACLG